jgi:hypothetical protein
VHGQHQNSIQRDTKAIDWGGTAHLRFERLDGSLMAKSTGKPRRIVPPSQHSVSKAVRKVGGWHSRLWDPICIP